MRDNLSTMLRAAAKEWREKNKVVATGATRYDAALEEAADAIEELQKRVPKVPHGRLIDADALRADWLENGENEYVYDTNAFLDSIDAAPTIIQAEENDRSVIYCKECRVVQTCPCQKEKDERAGNPFKEVMGCNKGIPTIIPAEEGEA